MKNDLVWYTAIFIGMGLGLLYIVFLVHAFAVSNWSHATEIQFAIFFTLSVRLIVLITISKQISSQPVIAYVVLSFEVFLIPLLAVLGLWTHNSSYNSLMSVILTSWIGASALLVSPYAIYQYAKGLLRTRSLLGVLVIGTLEVASMLFLVTVTEQARSIYGPSSLGQMIIQTTGINFTSVSSTSISNIPLEAGLVIYFVATLSYVSLGRVSTSLSVRLSRAFLLPLGGVIVAIIWVFSISFISSDLIFVFTVPTLVGAAVMWGIAHVR